MKNVHFGERNDSGMQRLSKLLGISAIETFSLDCGDRREDVNVLEQVRIAQLNTLECAMMYGEWEVSS